MSKDFQLAVAQALILCGVLAATALSAVFLGWWTLLASPVLLYLFAPLLFTLMGGKK